MSKFQSHLLLLKQDSSIISTAGKIQKVSKLPISINIRDVTAGDIVLSLPKGLVINYESESYGAIFRIIAIDDNIKGTWTEKLPIPDEQQIALNCSYPKGEEYIPFIAILKIKYNPEIQPFHYKILITHQVPTKLLIIQNRTIALEKKKYIAFAVNEGYKKCFLHEELKRYKPLIPLKKPRLSLPIQYEMRFFFQCINFSFPSQFPHESIITPLQGKKVMYGIRIEETEDLIIAEEVPSMQNLYTTINLYTILAAQGVNKDFIENTYQYVIAIRSILIYFGKEDLYKRSDTYNNAVEIRETCKLRRIKIIDGIKIRVRIQGKTYECNGTYSALSDAGDLAPHISILINKDFIISKKIPENEIYICSNKVVIPKEGILYF